MSPRRNADAFCVQVMVVLCFLWGIQQVVIKLAAHDIAPILQASLRSGIAALLVGLLMTFRGGWEGLRQGTLRGGLLAGVLFAVEFLFISLGLTYTSAGHVAVFLYTAPVFSALGLHLLVPGERLRPMQWLGIAVCFAGIAVAFIGGAAGTQLDARTLLGDAFAVGGGLAYTAYSGVMLKGAYSPPALRGSAVAPAPGDRIVARVPCFVGPVRGAVRPRFFEGAGPRATASAAAARTSPSCASSSPPGSRPRRGC